MQVKAPLSQHDRMFQTLAGSVCAAAALVALMLACRAQGVAMPLNASLVLIVASAAFVAYYQFPLLLSARRASFMLGRAARKWLQASLWIALGYFVVPGIERDVPRTALLACLMGSLPLVLLSLALLRAFAIRLYGSARRRRVAVLLCPGPQARMLAQRLARSPVLGVQLAGYFGTPMPASPGLPTWLGSLEDAQRLIAENRFQIVFVDASVLSRADAAPLLRTLGDGTAAIYGVPEAPPGFTIEGTQLAGVPLIALHETGILGLAGVLKRLMDILFASLAILLLSPLLLALALGVRASSRGPILFRQQRAGRGSAPIAILKFRSMYVHTEHGTVTQATRNDPRITPFGRLLRRTSLDELPQLFNVLGGSMSLVGPRPHAVEHNTQFRQQIDGYMLRHTIKPGITGWAQVNGLRGETDTVDKMRRRVEFDRYYIQHWSPWLDVRILWRTVWLVVRDSAAY